jgi:hypothetical protein
LQLDLGLLRILSHLGRKIVDRRPVIALATFATPDHRVVHQMRRVVSESRPPQGDGTAIVAEIGQDIGIVVPNPGIVRIQRMGAFLRAPCLFMQALRPEQRAQIGPDARIPRILVKIGHIAGARLVQLPLAMQRRRRIGGFAILRRHARPQPLRSMGLTRVAGRRASAASNREKVWFT